MAKKPHIRLNSKNQSEQVVKMDFNYGFGDQEEKEKEEPDYVPMAEAFRRSLARLNTDLTTRRQERSETLQIPAHIDYIQIRFQDQFNITKFFQSWYNDFGLLGVNFFHFNREVLFAVVDQNKFVIFVQGIENFILKESGENNQVEYTGKVKFIRDFKLLTTPDILNYQDRVQLMNFKLIEFPAGSEDAFTIYNRLQQYLAENEYDYRLIEDAGVLEVFGASQESIEEIAKNFDIVLSVTSSLSTVVRPSELNTVERDYGFEISNSDENLPIIGILDTGISNTTPLAPILINDDRFNLTGSSPFVDNANDGFGHGTSVAALAALGRKPYSVNYTGTISADAKLLSMKILDADSGHLSVLDILEMLDRAKAEYPEVKLFVLTTCYLAFKTTNEDFSAYAYELDKFAHKNDCLIFICTANNNNAAGFRSYDLNYYSNEEANLCSPAESMNNITVGAAGGCFRNPFVGASLSEEFPALYSRKSHVDLEAYKKPNKGFTKNNSHLFKPDLIEFGGDYEERNGFIGKDNDALMDLLSANPAFGFYRDAGTSFSTPLVANIAAQIQRNYPTLKTQSIKALILNAASLEAIPYDNAVVKLRNKTAGHGLANPDQSISSTDNTITFVIEDEISPDEMKVIPLNFPTYLTGDNLGKKRGVLQLTATLCFSFEPVPNNHLGYCPIQMAFAIFRNHAGNDILRSENEDKGGIKSKLKKSWSQNNRWKSTPIPASNTQKIEFPISVKDLEDEGSTFKLAVHSLISTQLLAPDKYKTTHPFSMAITIEERLPEAKQTGKLYAEMLAVNEVENIISVEGEAEAEGDV